MEIELPDGTILEAPDDADPSAVAKAYLSKQKQPQRTRTWGEQIKRDAGLTARTGINAVAALPMMAMDAGVALRNLLPNQNYELPSSMFQRALTDAGLPEPETNIEKGSMLLGEVAMGSKLPLPERGMFTKNAPPPVPENFTPRDTVAGVTLKEGREAGLVVPPSTSNPTIKNRLLESLGGKVATQQEASMHNQSVANALANKALGRPAGAQFSREAMQDLRNNVVESAYKPVRGIGTIRLDSKFTQSLDDVTAKVDKVAKQFPELGDQKLSQTIQSLKMQSVDSDVAVDTISVLRDKAKDAYTQGNSEAGRAYKQVAKAFEDAIERSLERRGKDASKILADYRKGRQLIAKSGSVEKAINEGTGNVSIRALSQQLQRGAPLTDELETLARFGKAFPKAAQEITDSPVSNVDIGMSAGVAALSESAAPLIYPFSRMGARQFLLSPTGQRLATPAQSTQSPRTALGILYGSGLLRE